MCVPSRPPTLVSVRRCGRIGAGLASHVIRDMAPWKAACKARYTALSFDVTYSAAPELTRALATLSDSLEALCAHYDPVTLREVLRALLPTLTVDIFNTGEAIIKCSGSSRLRGCYQAQEQPPDSSATPCSLHHLLKPPRRGESQFDTLDSRLPSFDVQW